MTPNSCYNDHIRLRKGDIMKDLKEIYEKNIKSVVLESRTLKEAEKNLNLENVYYKEYAWIYGDEKILIFFIKTSWQKSYFLLYY